MPICSVQTRLGRRQGARKDCTRRQEHHRENIWRI